MLGQESRAFSTKDSDSITTEHGTGRASDAHTLSGKAFGKLLLRFGSCWQVVKPDASGDPDALEKGEAKGAAAGARPIQRDDTAHGSLAARTAASRLPEE